MAGRILPQSLFFFTALIFAVPINANTNPEKPTEIRFSYTKSRSILIQARIADRDAMFLIDTGSGDTYVDFKALHLKLAADGNADVLTPTGRETRPVYKTGILIGPYNLTGAVTDLDLASFRNSCACDVKGILGMNALHRFSSVEIDFKAGVLRLKE